MVMRSSPMPTARRHPLPVAMSRAADREKTVHRIALQPAVKTLL